MIIKDKKNINYKALILLLIYLIGNSTALWHHEHKDLNKKNAPTCQKSVEKDTKCGHESHLSQGQKKCNLCDHHTLKPHILHFYSFDFVAGFSLSKNYFSKPNYNFLAFTFLLNKGPPQV